MIDACWQVTGWYLLVLLPLVVCMKLLSLRRNPPGGSSNVVSFILAPSLSFPHWQKRRRVRSKDVVVLVAKSLLYCTLLWLVFHFEIRIPGDVSPWLQGYLAVIPFWLMIEMVQTLLQILWLPTGRLVPHINLKPIQSVSLAEFWGRRWNRLFGAWLYEICFKPFRRIPHRGLLLAFLTSGLIHELLVTVPYLVVYKKSLFGLMSCYFIIQFLAICLERSAAVFPFTGRVYCWLVVLGPAPMVLNSGTLKIFQMIGSC